MNDLKDYTGSIVIPICYRCTRPLDGSNNTIGNDKRKVCRYCFTVHVMFEIAQNKRDIRIVEGPFERVRLPRDKMLYKYEGVGYIVVEITNDGFKMSRLN